MDTISVLVVDGNPTFLQLLVRFLEERALQGISVAGAAFRPADAAILAAAQQPQIAVVGINGDAQRALDTITHLRAVHPSVQILATAQMDIAEYRQLALDAGAARFLSKDTLHRDLIAALQELVGSGAGNDDT